MSWSGVGDAYASSYAELCAGTTPTILRLLGDAAGREVVDVGAGDGRLAQALQDAGWRVAACEPEVTMRAVARREHPTVPVVSGGLPDLPFPAGSADAVVANFVLNHLDDPRAGAAALRRASRNLTVATTWSQSPSWFWAEVTERAELRPSAGERLPADKDFERTASGFAAMLADAGWHPEVSELTWTWQVSADALWRSVRGGVAGAGAFYAGLDAQARLAFRSGFDTVIAQRADANILTLEHTAAIAVDRRR